MATVMLFGGKIFVIGAIAILALGFSTRVLHWNSDHTKCFQKRDWSHGSWHTWAAIGKLEFRVKDFGCEREWKLDPDKWQKDASGNITPKLTD